MISLFHDLVCTPFVTVVEGTGDFVDGRVDVIVESSGLRSQLL